MYAERGYSHGHSVVKDSMTQIRKKTTQYSQQVTEHSTNVADVGEITE